MKHILIGAAMLLPYGNALATEAQHIAPDELRLAGISIGLPEREVVKLLGKPIARRNSGESVELRYKGMVVSVSAAVNDTSVFEISAFTPSACTPAHVCPGMPVSALLSAYGPAVIAVRETGTFLEFTPHQSTCWLQVRERKGVIVSLRVACQP